MSTPDHAEMVPTRRRAVGRVLVVTALVGVVAAAVGVVVAWTLVGDLRRGVDDSLRVTVESIETIEDTLEVAAGVNSSVVDGLADVQAALESVGEAAAAGQDTLVVVAQLAEDIPPNLDNIDDALGRLQGVAGVIDSTLRAVSRLPVGPDFDPDQPLDDAVADVRGDLRPIADALRHSQDEFDALVESAEGFDAEIAAITADLESTRTALADADVLIERYQASAAEAGRLAVEARDRAGADVTRARVLVVVIGVLFALGQLAPYTVGRWLQAPDPVTGPDATAGSAPG